MFAGDIADHERLNDSVLPDRFDEFAQRVPRKIFPRLQGTRHDRRQFDLLNFLAGFGFEANTGRPCAYQRAKTFAESRLRHEMQVIGWRSRTQTALVGGDSVKPKC
jgi:hypothetical protein